MQVALIYLPGVRPKWTLLVERKAKERALNGSSDSQLAINLMKYSAAQRNHLRFTWIQQSLQRIMIRTKFIFVIKRIRQTHWEIPCWSHEQLSNGKDTSSAGDQFSALSSLMIGQDTKSDCWQALKNSRNLFYELKALFQHSKKNVEKQARGLREPRCRNPASGTGCYHKVWTHNTHAQ